SNSARTGTGRRKRRPSTWPCTWRRSWRSPVPDPLIPHRRRCCECRRTRLLKFFYPVRRGGVERQSRCKDCDNGARVKRQRAKRMAERERVCVGLGVVGCVSDLIDMLGARIGRVVAIERAANHPCRTRRRARWHWRCDCGREGISTGAELRRQLKTRKTELACPECTRGMVAGR